MSDKRVAYFCMEYGLDASFRIYSGGLGILAGDILKAAHDLQKPMVGIGILWRQGYVSQKIGKNGKPVDCFWEYSYDFLKDTGEFVAVKVRGQAIKLKIWLCDCFGNVPLYLLDANLPENADRLITGQLYGWFAEERIAQEIILGVGGVKALKKLGIEPDIYHFNDSHPVFAGLELIREEKQKGNSFETALAKAREKIVFTTHTPVPSGNEVHPLKLLRYMGAAAGFTREEIIKIGGDPFNMTVAGLHMSYIANGVAQLHGETARKMWGFVKNAAPIYAITNGVHNATWQDCKIADAAVRGENIFPVHEQLKKDMLAEIERRTSCRLTSNVLTIGFARRAAPYKRGGLIFGRMDIMRPLLEERKIQLVFSGKAHPNDLTGKEIVSEMYEWSQEFPQSIVFLQDYDMQIGALLTRGCDIWLNTPRRPMEASGTSGMKAAMNGVLNFSVLDGWWPEGCVHGVNGWQIGNGYEGENVDEADRDSLYQTLLEEILPMYYEKPEKWEKMMLSSIQMSQEKFSAVRMVNEYYGKMYNKQ